MTDLKKEFKFNKVAYTSSRKVNLPVIEMVLRDADTDKPKLSISGELWNAPHTDIVMGGQCLDELAEFDELNSNSTFKELYRLWKLYHLNDMCPASRSQKDALIAEFGVIPNYDKACKYLKSIDLYEDENNYEYGSSWVYHKIPANDLTEIKNLILGC